MNTIYKILALITLFSDIQGHGFCSDTYIRSSNYWQRIEQLSYESTYDKKVMSYDVATKKYAYRNVVSIRPGRTNCYIKIGLDDSRSNGIICTPSQEFYLPERDVWVEACALQVGDKLLSMSHKLKPIVYVELIAEPRDIYIIEIEDLHTFFVGEHTILVKNMILPCVTIGYVFPFGGGAGSGLLSTILGGTVTCTLGCVVGGVAIGYAINYYITGREKSYDFNFDLSQLGILFQEKIKTPVDDTIEIPAELPKNPEEAVADDDNTLPKTIEEILQGALPGDETNGPSTIFEKPGTTYQHTEEDFDSTKPTEVRPIRCGRAGKLPDGRWIVARWESNDGRPTLEVQGPGRNRTKIRYG